VAAVRRLTGGSQAGRREVKVRFAILEVFLQKRKANPWR
jgi:hypothetical protein